MSESKFFSNINAAPGFIANAGINKSNQNRKLIVIQFSGGNDGLNAIIPYQNDIYYKSRKRIAIKKPNQIIMDDNIAFNNAMKEFADLFNQGYVNVINDVGYPNRTRSHFKSMDIWHSANAETSKKNSGWIGRYLDATCNNQNNGMFKAIEISDLLNLVLKGEKQNGVALDNMPELIEDLGSCNVEEILKSVENESFKENQNLEYLYNLLYQGNESAKPIYKKYKNLSSKFNFPKSKIGNDLKKVCELILCDISTQIYYVTHGSFDTHSDQIGKQFNLLSAFSKALSAFVSTLKANNKMDEVCIMVFSEFGRRVEENASQGTDHGTANNLYVINSHFSNPGFYNEINSLQKLVGGDLAHKIDFRRIYAAILEDWLMVDSLPILNKKYDKLNLFQPNLTV